MVPTKFGKSEKVKKIVLLQNLAKWSGDLDVINEIVRIYFFIIVNNV